MAKLSHSQALKIASQARASGNKQKARAYGQMARDMSSSRRTGRTRRQYYDRKTGRISHTEVGSEKYVESFTTDRFIPINKKQVKDIRSSRKKSIQLIVPTQIIKQKGKAVFIINPGEKNGAFTQSFKGKEGWTVKYGISGDERRRTFKTEKEAKNFMGNIHPIISEQVHRMREGGYTSLAQAREGELTPAQRAYDKKIYELNKLIDQDLIIFDSVNRQYNLTKPVQYLSDKEEKDLQQVGFDLPLLKESLSWRLLEQARAEKSTFKEGPLGIPYSPKGVKTATAIGVAGLELFLSQFLGLLGPKDRGEFDIRNKQYLDIDRIEKVIPNITRGEVTAARAIGYGIPATANAVTLAVLGSAIGTAAGFTGQAIADKLATPIGKTTFLGKVASKIPGGAKSLNTLGAVKEAVKPYAGKAIRVGEAYVLGYLPLKAEAKKITTLREAGLPWEAVSGHVLMDVAAYGGFAYGMGQGLKKGKDVYSKTKYYTTGRGEIVKSTDVVPSYVKEGEGRFPSFKGDKLKPTKENYLKLAQKYAPDEIRIGDGIPEWSASPDPFHTVFDVRTGLNKRGEVGMFFSYAGSEHFLRLGDDAVYSLAPGLPRFNASPQWVYAEFKDIIATNFGKQAVGGMGDLLDDIAGSGKLVMPSAATQLGESQAILSGGTKMVEVAGGKFWMQHGGRLVKIGRYLPEVTAMEMGVPIVKGSAQTYEALLTAISSGGVSVSPSTYLPVSFPMVSGEYPEVDSLISKLEGMSKSDLVSWSSSASSEELAIILSVISSSQYDISYTSALSLSSPTIINYDSNASSRIIDSSSNLSVDYGSSVSDLIYPSSTYPPSPDYTYDPSRTPDYSYDPTPPPPIPPPPVSPPIKGPPTPIIPQIEIDKKALKDTQIPRLGKRGRYKITLQYQKRPSEIKNVNASNYIEAVSKGVDASRKRAELVQVEAEKIGRR